MSRNRPSGVRTHDLRHRIADRDGWQCFYCHKATSCMACDSSTIIVATVEHLTPWADGGKHRLENLVIACADCNGKRDRQELAVFIQSIA